MRSIAKTAVILAAITAIAIPLMLLAGTTGKIKGHVTDINTGDPIAGASVQIIGTTMGAMTDPDGRYTIALVPSGAYTLNVSAIGYNSVEVCSVNVSVDISTEINVTMTPATAGLDKVIKIVADRSKIDIYKVSSEVIISKNAIKNPPVKNLDELLQQTAGVSTDSKGDIIIRGGRAGEVAYIIEGAADIDLLGGRGPNEIVVQKRQNIQPKVQADYSYCYPSPAHGGTSIVNGEPFDAMFFKNYGVNPFVDTEDDHLSTFAIDVDDASYIMARSYLERGELPPDDAIRAEEFINHFDYDYTAPEESPFSVFVEGGPSHFGQNSRLLQIGIKGHEINPRNRKPANLVFVIDVSGSMATENRLGLVKRGLQYLVNQLKNRDRVGIVIYGSRGSVLLHPTSIDRREEILRAIENLAPGGSTNAAEGLRLGYDMADRMFDRNKINRIILCSDGVANVGITRAEDLLRDIKRYADKGITLSAIGFGMANYNDILMEKLGDKGNGHYAYVNDITEARRVFVDNLTGMLEVIARDVKIQVDFNPNVVRSYRLIGYENRDVADEKFRDDKEDGGEIGAGHNVTALYEIKLHRNFSHEHVARVYIRYKKPNEMNRADEIEFTVDRSDFNNYMNQCSSQFKLATAVAEFAEILRKSYWAKGSNLTAVADLARDVYNSRPTTEVMEFLNMISMARQYEEQLAENE
jgi:Ca-activated chloride channel family protein